jgi:hypothetical protein
MSDGNGSGGAPDLPHGKMVRLKCPCGCEATWYGTIEVAGCQDVAKAKWKLQERRRKLCRAQLIGVGLRHDGDARLRVVSDPALSNGSETSSPKPLPGPAPRVAVEKIDL